MRFLFKTVAYLTVLGLVLAAAALAWGHIHIRRIDPELPSVDEVLEIDAHAALPVRISWINTASQEMPRSAVLEKSLDPRPEDAYTMSHPSFVVEWQDGRMFLIDLGMDNGAAMGFGQPLEAVVGAERLEPHTSASERLGRDRVRIAGIGFTHLHDDHVQGLEALCADIETLGQEMDRIPVFLNRHQMMEVNHTTRGPKKTIEDAPCAKRQAMVTQESHVPVPGFPGLYTVAAGGHTPGSQLFVVHVRTFPGQSEGRRDDVETWVITGDVANHADGIAKDVPKPHLYSLLVVPEHEERLARVRHFVRKLGREPGVHVLVNHDQQQIEGTPLRPY